MTYDEMMKVFRKSFPGLNISKTELSDEEMRGFWKLLDDDRSSVVEVAEFMRFMRKNATMQMHKLTTYAKEKRGLVEKALDLGPVPRRSRDELRAIAKSLDDELALFWAQQGVRLKASEFWEEFFKDADNNGNGRLNFQEFENHLRSKLKPRRRTLNTRHSLLDRASSPRASSPFAPPAMGGHRACMPAPSGAKTARASLPANTSAAATGAAAFVSPPPPGEVLVVRGVSHDDFHALWDTVDADKSGEVNVEEWRLGLYRLDLETYPSLNDNELQKVVETISYVAQQKLHGAGGNWYKVFRLVDLDGSGSIGPSELFDMLRRPLPCLDIKEEQISTAEMRGLWKALDADRSGVVSFTEFMVFMRRMDINKGKIFTPTAARGSVVHRASVNRRQAHRAESLAPAKAKLLAESLQHLRNNDSILISEWPSHVGQEWRGEVNEWHWPALARGILELRKEDITDAELHIAWSAWDRDGKGFLSFETMLERCAVPAAELPESPPKKPPGTSVPEKEEWLEDLLAEIG